MNNFKKVDGYGEAAIFRGDPRHKETDIDSWYQGILREESSATKRPYLYGSDAGLCARRNVLLEHNSWLPSSKSPATAAYMAIGVGLEDMLAAALKRNEKLLVQSLRLIEMPEVKISGKIDLVVFDHEDKLSLIEVKTCGELPPEPKPTHLAQIQTYAAVSGVHRCWLTYISRNVRDSFTEKLSLRSFLVDTSQEVLVSRLKTALLSRLASNERKLPPVPATFRKHTECHYCEFRDHFCWGARPGLGGNEAESPLQSYTPGEMAALDSMLTPISLRLYEESLSRQLKTLRSISTIELSAKLHERTMAEQEMVMAALAGFASS